MRDDTPTTEDVPLRRLRLHLKLTQVELAAALHVGQGRVSAWESGSGISGPYAARILGLYSRQMRNAGVTQIQLLTQGEASQ